MKKTIDFFSVFTAILTSLFLSVAYGGEIYVDGFITSNDTKVDYIGKTSFGFFTSTPMKKELSRPQIIRKGQTINGIKINAILCTYHDSDSFYGGIQFMWKGRYSCMAGRSKTQLITAIDSNGNKMHDYLAIVPVSLKK